MGCGLGGASGLAGSLFPAATLSASLIPRAHSRLRPQHQGPVVRKGRPKSFALIQQHPRCASPPALPFLLLHIRGLVLTAWIA